MAEKNDNKKLESSIERQSRLLRESADKQEENAKKIRIHNENQKGILKSVNLGIMEQTRIAKAEQDRKKADRLDLMEKQREAKTVGESIKVARERIGKNIEEPSFLKKIFKLALGIFGAAVFVKLVQNFDQVKAFTTDKLIPALKSTFTFLKDTLTPVFEFIANNFTGVVTGVAVAAGTVIGARIFIRIINMFKDIFVALQAIRTFLVGMGRNFLLIGKFLGGKLMGAVKLLAQITRPFRIFMMKTFIPNMIGMFKSMMAKPFSILLGGISKVILLAKAFKAFMLATFLPAIGGFIMGLITSLGAVLIPLAIPIAIALGIAAVVAGIGFALTKLRDALGFESIFDVLMLGVMHLKDAFGHVVNFVGSIVNFILGIIEKFAKYIPGFEDIELPRIPKMATDSAEKFKIQKQEEAKAAEAEAKPEQKPRSEMNRFERVQARMAREKEEMRRAEERKRKKEPVSLRRQQAQERKEELRARAAAGDPNVVVTTSRGGMMDDAQAEALSSGKMTMAEVLAMKQKQQQDLTPPQTAGGGNVANAVVNAPVSTTNVNNATTVMDAEPAIDGLDRFAMGGAF